MSAHEHETALQGADLGRPTFGVASRFVQKVLARLQYGRLVVETPSGRRISRRAPLAGPEATIVIHDWRALRRVITGGSNGFAEGYLAGEWTSPDVSALIELFAANTATLETSWSGSVVSRFVGRLLHRIRANSRRGSRRNISFHYDLGNAFYESWLDRGMQYSSAIYAEGDDLEAAQERKLDRIADLLDLKGGERVLEIGFGWGALAERLIGSHGSRFTGLTLSERQLAYADERLAGSGLSAELKLQDYRDCTGTFDRIVSIEMIEAVGERYWRQYFELLRDRMTPDGHAVIQAITIEESRFEEYRRDPDFIQRYIFPGGMLPTVAIMRREAEAAGLSIVACGGFGGSYARTLAEWRTRFHAAWPKIQALGFDERFRLTWDYYLAYCEGGFRAGAIDVGLFRLARA
jgi:cyclopropane-fatty-acyl-phospholipid synthase